MPHTLAQKILQAHTDEEVREAGQIVNCHLSGVLANDITGPLAIKSFRAMGAAKVFDKDRVFLVMDHFTPNKDKVIHRILGLLPEGPDGLLESEKAGEEA